MSKSVDIISVVLFVQCEPFFLHVNSNTGVCALNVGGNYNSNANYGFFYFNANNTASNSNANLGSRHLVFLRPCTDRTLPLGKNIADRTWFSRPLERP